MAAGATYEPIATTTLGSAATSITFSSISGSYTDIVLVIDGTLSTSDWTLGLQCNSDTSALYSATYVTGNGTAASSNRASAETMALVGLMTNSQSNSIINIQNYSNTTTYKTLIGRWNSASGGTYPGTGAAVGLWRSTSAITSVVVKTGSGNFNSNSTFTLYGIKAA